MQIGNFSIELDAPKSSTKGVSIRQDNYGKCRTSRMLFRFYFGKDGWDGRPHCVVIFGCRPDCTGERKATKSIKIYVPYRRWIYKDHRLGRFLHWLSWKTYSFIDTRYK